MGADLGLNSERPRAGVNASVVGFTDRWANVSDCSMPRLEVAGWKVGGPYLTVLCTFLLTSLRELAILGRTRMRLLTEGTQLTQECNLLCLIICPISFPQFAACNPRFLFP